MYSSKENLDLMSTYSKTPYSRTNARKSDPTVEKILSKPRTSENSYGRNFASMRSPGLRNPHPNHHKNYQIFNEPLHDNPTLYGCIQDDYEAPPTSGYPEGYRNRLEYPSGQFRPRKPQSGRIRSVEKNLDLSLNHVELEMMNIGEGSKKSQSKFNKGNAQDINSKGFQIKSRENLFRIFTGSVDNLLHWFRLKNNFQIIFEVTATLDDLQKGKWKSEKILFLSDYSTGPSLQVLYYEIDRPLPKFSIKSTVTCVGRLITRNRLHAFKVEEASEARKNASKRLGFICNRVAEEIVAASQKK